MLLPLTMLKDHIESFFSSIRSTSTLKVARQEDMDGRYFSPIDRMARLREQSIESDGGVMLVDSIEQRESLFSYCLLNRRGVVNM